MEIVLSAFNPLVIVLCSARIKQFIRDTVGGGRMIRQSSSSVGNMNRARASISSTLSSLNKMSHAFRPNLRTMVFDEYVFAVKHFLLFESSSKFIMEDFPISFPTPYV